MSIKQARSDLNSRDFISRWSCLSLTLFFLLSSALRGQDSSSAVPPEPTPIPGTRAQPPASLPGLPDEGPIAPVPPPPAQVPELEKLDQMFKGSSLGKAADEARLHLQWRTLVSRVQRSPDLVAARTVAEGARTDAAKRTGLRHYYKAFFARMRAHADTPELQGYLADREAEHLSLLAEPKVRPETAVPLPSPSATAKAKKPPKHKAGEPELPR